MAKDWKGNSASVRSRLGIQKDHTTKGREQDDFYATDPVALERLLDGCSDWLLDIFTDAKDTAVWECACGNGNLADKLLHRRFNVWATDLKDRGYGMSGVDFLQTTRTPEDGINVIITNPPYSLANEFILHALDILPEGGVYVALMNITYLAGQKRYNAIYSKGSLRDIYIFSKRIECWRNNDRETYGNKAMVDFAWYVFQKGFKGQPTLYWL